MRYRRLLAPAVVIPKQTGHAFWQPQVLMEGAVVGVMKKNSPSSITGKANEITVKWRDAAKRDTLGWLAKNTPMDNKMSKKELSRGGAGEVRVAAWDTVRKRIGTSPGWDAKTWICSFAETNLPLLHAVIRELGGKVPKTDDQFAAISRAVKLTTGEDITMKDATKSKKTSGKKGGKKTSTKKTSTKKAKRSGGPGRTSAFAGKRIIRLVKENPRRAGTRGYKSWRVIKKGMVYEDFLKAGGNRGALAKEVRLGRVKLK